MLINKNLECLFSKILNYKNDCKPMKIIYVLFFLTMKSIHGTGTNNFILIFFSAKTHVKQDLEKQMNSVEW